MHILSRRWFAGLVVTGIGLGVIPLLANQKPSLTDVLTRVAEYHTSYASKFSGVSVEEAANLMDVGGGVMRGTVRLSSDVVFVKLGGQVVALRDPYALDTRPLRPRTPRILALLAAPATPTIRDWQVASSYPNEGAIHFLLDITVKVNEPTSALQFVSAARQASMKYRLDGEKKMNNVAVVGLRFEEPERDAPPYVFNTRSNARAAGRVWIDAATGAIHQTELWVSSQTEEAIVSVKYAPHATLGLLLPTEMNETYEQREGGGGPRQPGGESDPRTSVAARASVQSRAQYSKAAFAAIDLTKLK